MVPGCTVSAPQMLACRRLLALSSTAGSREMGYPSRNEFATLSRRRTVAHISICIDIGHGHASHSIGATALGPQPWEYSPSVAAARRTPRRLHQVSANLGHANSVRTDLAPIAPALGDLVSRHVLMHAHRGAPPCNCRVAAVVEARASLSLFSSHVALRYVTSCHVMPRALYCVFLSFFFFFASPSGAPAPLAPATGPSAGPSPSPSPLWPNSLTRLMSTR